MREIWQWGVEVEFIKESEELEEDKVEERAIDDQHHEQDIDASAFHLVYSKIWTRKTGNFKIRRVKGINRSVQIVTTEKS
jgi:hypothetical protein